VEIKYTIGECRLGRLLVASTEKGLCMVSIGSSDAELERKLYDHFADVSVGRDDRAMSSSVRAVNRLIDGQQVSDTMSLDLRGTPFQMEVWNEMLRIPVGSTRSYADVAKRIGRPKAFRAVAQACGANPVAIVVPCHRVVASRGGLGGYGLGVDKKILLLAAEGVQNPEWTA
jgi:AraC family transcriptional regulator of adaptative response/methylated-DNA-[protein]-cysteine methyltransferase